MIEMSNIYTPARIRNTTFTSGQGDYTSAVDWLERADTIPLAPSDYREGIKVTQEFICL